MRRHITIVVVCITAAILLTFGGCASTGNAGSSTSSSIPSSAVVTPASSAAATASSAQKIFTKDELKKYDGQNGNPAYVAVNGVVYDVTNAKQWNNGSHQGHSAGQDLTSVIASAPHGTSVLKDLPVVGKLQ